MRIFSNHRELAAALKLPADAAGAYRFKASFGIAGFQCDQCGAVKVFPVGKLAATGYALIPQGTCGHRFACYACADALERASLAQHPAVFSAYVSGDKKQVTTWTGGRLAKITHYSESRSGWNRATIARFHALDANGQWWQGRGPGGGMYCTLRPMNRPDYARRWGALK